MTPRVAMVAASLDILGGQGVQAATLMDHLEGDGQRLLFIPINPSFPRVLAGARRLPYVRTLLNQALYLPALRRLRGADIAHVFSASYWSFCLAVAPAIAAARSLGKRVIVHYHSGEAPDHLANWGALVHPWLRWAHEIVVPSRFLAEVFSRFGYRVHEIPNVIDLSRFVYRERDPRGLRFLSVRNLESHYRVENTLRAFEAIRSAQPEATLTVAGYGSQEASLRAAFAGRPGIRFLGRVEPEAIPGLYDAHDVFLNSSVIDNQPVSILEAFASGLPVVTTATGGIADMVEDGTTGLIVPADRPLAMAVAALRLVQQPGWAAALAARARTRAARHSWPEVRERWLKLYNGRA